MIFLPLVYMLILLAAGLLLLLYTQPAVLRAAVSRPEGRILLAAVAVLGALIHPALGLLVVAAYVISASDQEGFDTKPGTTSGVPRFRSTHCVKAGDGKRSLIGPRGTVVRPPDVTKEFTRVRFKGEPCNPCDSDCVFDLLAVEEGFRSRMGAEARALASVHAGVVAPPMLGSAQQHERLVGRHPWTTAVSGFVEPDLIPPPSSKLPELEI